MAQGKLTLLIGDPGLGKSSITLDTSARVSVGKAWPDGGTAPLGSNIILTAEDGLADTVRPRVDALGGDPARVFALLAVREGNKERGFSLAKDLAVLEEAIRRVNAVFVAIDPVTAYFGSKDSYKDTEVREVLAPLAALADQTGVAMVGVMHLNKDAQKAAIYRGLGSIGFVGQARAVFLVVQDPEDESRRFMGPIKLNIAAPPPTLAFTLPNGVLTWEPKPVAIDIRKLLSGADQQGDRKERVVADGFLSELLKDGPVLAEEVFRIGAQQGFSQSQLNHAKSRLGVVSKRIDGVAGSGAWVWKLPE